MELEDDLGKWSFCIHETCECFLDERNENDASPPSPL